GERGSIYVLHREIGQTSRAAFRIGDAGFEYLGNTRMLELPEQPDFSLEPATAGHAGVERESISQHFACHFAPRMALPRQVDDSHSALSEASFDFIRTDPRRVGRGGSHRWRQQFLGDMAIVGIESRLRPSLGAEQFFDLPADISPAKALA